MASIPPPFDPTGGPPPLEPSPVPPSEPPLGDEPPVAALPFEQPGFPFLEGLYETAKLVVTTPTEAFGRVRASGDLGRPLLYAVVFGWVGIIASQIYNLAFRGAMWKVLPGFAGHEEMFFSTGLSIATMVLAPILVVIGVFLGALIFHLFLLLVGGAGGGLATTVRVICYTSTVQITQVVPFCGGIVGGIWALVLYIIGFAAAHRTSHGKAALAVLLPVVLCCVCIAAVAALFGAAIAAAFAGSR